MKINRNRQINAILIIGGFIFIAIGLFGFVSPKIEEHYSLKNQSFRLYSLEKSDGNYLQDQLTVDLPAITEDPVVGNNEIFIDFESGIEYVHVQYDQKLENPNIPTRISIPSIKLEAPVISADYYQQEVEGDNFGLWEAPDSYAAGWHPDSALLGETGNTVINGHHNVDGKVFENLIDITIGDVILVYAGENKFTYVVNNTMILKEVGVDLETRIENARWLAESNDERLTLVTCWPAKSNTHRLIVVAQPSMDD